MIRVNDMNEKSTARRRTISLAAALGAAVLLGGCALPDNYGGGGAGYFGYIDGGRHYRGASSIGYYDPYYDGYSPYFGSLYYGSNGFSRGQRGFGFRGRPGGGKHGGRDRADQDQDHAGDGDGDRAGKDGGTEKRQGNRRGFVRGRRGGEADGATPNTSQAAPPQNPGRQTTRPGSAFRPGIARRRSGNGATAAASSPNRSSHASSSSASPSSTRSSSASSHSRRQGARMNSRPSRASRFQPRRNGGNRGRQRHRR